MKNINWSDIRGYNTEMGINILGIPLINEEESIQLIKKEIKNNSSILDIGAGNKNFKNLLKNKKIVSYKSMDIDKSHKHDFYSIKTVKGSFDIALMLDVIEHIDIPTFYEYLKKINKVLKNNSTVIIRFPNVFALGSYQNFDSTHKQLWPYFDVCSILKKHNFKNIRIYRINYTNLFGSCFDLSWKLPYRLVFKVPLRLVKYVFRELFVRTFEGTDYAQNMLIIAKR